MKYTENYHLPQWVKTDRIMMDDFNAAMAGIENGLSKGAENHGRTMDHIHRLAYNHYCTVQDMDPFPWQSGVFHQNFVKDQSGLTGTLGWDGARFAGKGDTASASYAEAYQEITPLHMVAGNLSACSPLTATFRAPSGGKVNFCTMLIQSTASHTSALNYRLRLSLTNLDTGREEFSVTDTLKSVVGSSAIATHTFSKGFYFLGYTNYLIKIEPLDAVWNADGSANIDQSDNGFIANAGIASAEHAIHEPSASDGGFAVLRCVMGGDSGTLQFLWDGQELQPSLRRWVTLNDGKAFEELIYLREDEIPADSTISLHFESGETGSILLRDWGVVLL